MRTLTHSRPFISDTPDAQREVVQLWLSLGLWFWLHKDEFLLLVQRVNRVIGWVEDWCRAWVYTIETIKGLFRIEWGYLPG